MYSENSAKWVQYCGFDGEKSEVQLQTFNGEQNAMTIEYMLRHGWENVRWGLWSQVEFQNPPLAYQKVIGKNINNISY